MNIERPMKPRIRKCLLWAAVGLCLYGCGYGIARWRKCIVMREYNSKDDYLLVRRTGPGHDVRENWRGRFKNRVNPALFVLFRPAAFVEDGVRGGVGPIGAS
jgi:hypothetical protein